MSSEVAKISINVELQNTHTYNEYDGELQQAIDQFVLKGVQDYIKRNITVDYAYDVNYWPIHNNNSPNLLLKVDFMVKFKIANYSKIAEDIEYEIIPADK